MAAISSGSYIITFLGLRADLRTVVGRFGAGACAQAKTKHHGSGHVDCPPFPTRPAALTLTRQSSAREDEEKEGTLTGDLERDEAVLFFLAGLAAFFLAGGFGEGERLREGERALVLVVPALCFSAAATCITIQPSWRGGEGDGRTQLSEGWRGVDHRLRVIPALPRLGELLDARHDKDENDEGDAEPDQLSNLEATRRAVLLLGAASLVQKLLDPALDLVTQLLAAKDREGSHEFA